MVDVGKGVPVYGVRVGRQPFAAVGAGGVCCGSSAKKALVMIPSTWHASRQARTQTIWMPDF